MKKAIKVLEDLLIASIRCGANPHFILGIQNAINELKANAPRK